MIKSSFPNFIIHLRRFSILVRKTTLLNTPIKGLLGECGKKSTHFNNDLHEKRRFYIGITKTPPSTFLSSKLHFIIYSIYKSKEILRGGVSQYLIFKQNSFFDIDFKNLLFFRHGNAHVRFLGYLCPLNFRQGGRGIVTTSKHFDEETVYHWWLDFISEPGHNRKSKIVSIADTSELVFTVGYMDLFESHPDLAECLVEDPEMTIRTGEAGIRSTLEPDQRVSIEIQVNSLPKAFERRIEDISVKDLSSLRYSDVLVYRRNQSKGLLLVGMFSCTSCGFKQEIDQDNYHFTEPLECPKDDGGCGKRTGSTTFKFHPKESLWLDRQRLYVQDLFDKSSKNKPDRAPVVMEGEYLVNKVPLEKRVRIFYRVMSKQEIEGKSKSSEFGFILKCVGYKLLDDVITYKITKEDINWMKRNSNQLIEWGVQSIAPWIYGYDILKLALWLQFIGVPAQETNGEAVIRGDFHILLFGDGGTGKSQLIKDMIEIWPKSHFASGKSSTSAGLTVAVVPDEFGKGNTLEAGVLLLADNGLAGIDELDKASKEDISSMHEALEGQTISVNKAGFNVTFPAHVTALCGANGRLERFIETMSIQEQSNFTDTLLQRFALKFKLMDKAIPELDSNRAKHSLMSKVEESPVGKRKITIEQMRKIRQYVQSIDPKIGMELMDYFVTQFVELRSQVEWANHRMITVDRVTQRTFEDLQRLSKAIARVRLHKKVDRNDVDLAVYLYKTSMEVIVNGENCSLKVDVSDTKPHLNRISQDIMINLIMKHDKRGNGAELSKVKTEVENLNLFGMDEILDKLLDEGLIIYPRSHKIQFVGRRATV